MVVEGKAFELRGEAGGGRCRLIVMRMKLGVWILGCLGLGVAFSPMRAEGVRLARDPALSPDGGTLAFAWQGDVWLVPVAGGTARRLTQHAAEESLPAFSPDGKRVAFVSTREGGVRQVFVMPAGGGEARQVTFHSEGAELREWLPDGKGLLVSVTRDASWMREPRAGRLAVVDVEERKAERVLFDDYGTEAAVAPDGKRVLFTREGESWWRQGYRGARAGQTWLFDRESGKFELILKEETECRWPRWRPDGKGFYFVSNRGGDFNLWERELESGKERQITRFKGDSVVFPAVSRNGRVVVFRVLADFYRWEPGKGGEPVKIPIEAVTDAAAPVVERPVLSSATGITHTADGLQMAFLAGGDLWVMDTELKEPVAVTRTAEQEREAVFSPDGKTLWFVSDAEGETDLWKAVRKNPAKPWWENTAFELTRVTNDAAVESRPQFSADGKRLAYVKGLGDLWVAKGDGSEAKRVLESWDAPSFEFSPDGRWLVYAVSDEWFNSDVWLLPADGGRAAFNLSRHPDNDYAPRWSPDGKKIAWVGQRENGEHDLFYAWLRAEEGEASARERTLEKAREKFKKPAVPAPAKPATAAANPAPQEAKAPPTKAATTPTTTAATTAVAGAAAAQATAPPKPAEPVKDEGQKKAAAPTPAPAAAKPAPALVIDFEGIHDRIRRIAIPNTTEGGLVWSPDSKRLAFAATVDGKKGTYTVEPPDQTRPKLLATAQLSGAQWLKEGDQLTGLAEGRPASVSAKTGAVTTRSFRAPQVVERAARQRAVFDECWRVMRDRYYDEALGNRDWNAVRAKYGELAAQAPDLKTVQEVVHLMLGELNGSHLGFTLNSGSGVQTAMAWQEETAHLGLRFDAAHAGPGWKVRDVLVKGPASRKQSRVKTGEVVLRVDGQAVTPEMDPSQVLTGRPDRDVTLQVRAEDGKEREVRLRPINHAEARKLLYDQWIRENRERVEKASGGKLGYLHISAMDDASFHRFQEELYAAGAGREGLVIDVRENGGGSTADHLLTALTQPRHAIAIPRGSRTPGYPQDRTVYATWDKPVVVLCNQNSYSNAEIFSHAIKLLKRGQLVGVPTAGGVISTGSTAVMDVGTLRLPFRGWYGLESGLDMELNGAVPDQVIWPQPGEMAAGVDRQLEKAVEVLTADVAAWKARPQPKLQKASERFGFGR